jgi:glutamine amidotransferase
LVPEITIIDYGVGNLASIENILKKIGVSSEISNNIEKIKNARKLILPGVGSFDYGISCLRELNIEEILNEKVLVNKTPILGLCLGFQLMTKSSEEGTQKGLGWFNANCVKFNLDNDEFKVPHMGWNYVTNHRQNILTNSLEKMKYYFVHSYHIANEQPEDIILQSTYGYTFTCGMQLENIYGVQFHPEKSHKFGMQLFKNFSLLQ